MESQQSKYKRIAHNTILLYIRFIVVLFISLFTSRIILQALGFNDYGLFNVVGGFVALLGFLNSYVSQGTTRFLTFELGTGNADKLKQTFSAAFFLHVVIAIIILIIGETIGLWYVENKLNIEQGRESTAIFVYELSLITACVGFMQTPFSASINAHEDMNIYAYISIFDVIMKLLVVYLLLIVNTDKLRLFCIFNFCVSLLTSSFYLAFCLRKYQECSFRLKPNISLYKKMLEYIGWNAIGSFAFTLNNQGITLLLNQFFGTVINAARGVASSLSNIVAQFVFNFQAAMRPQIIKTYANGEIDEMKRIVLYCAKYSSYLCMLFGIPLFIESDTVLHIWLGKVPPYSVAFVRITIIQIMIQAIDFPVGYGINAVGKMKLPNITSSLVYLMILPISYLSMRLGADPTIAYIITIVCFPIAMIFDVWILNKYIGFSKSEYYKKVVGKTIVFVAIASIIPALFHICLNATFLRLCIVTVVSLACSCPLIYFKGLDDAARKVVKSKISSIFLNGKRN